MKLSVLFESGPEFERWLKQSGHDARGLISSIMKTPPDGQGGNANFWKIPDSPFGLLVQRAGFKKAGVGQMAHQGDPFPGMNLGQAIANFGPNVSIVRLQSGTPAGMKFRYNRLPKEQQQQEVENFRSKLAQAANLPLEAYNKLLSQIVTINQKGYVVDPSKSGNLLVDDQGFHLVDINPRSQDGYQNNPGEIIVMLLNNFNFAKFFKDDDKAKQYAQVVIGKVESASKSLGIKIDNNGSVEYSYKLAGLR
jgi:hypothetical protein